MSLLQEEHPGADYLEKALNLMQSEYMNGITIQEMADRLGLNRSYFSELFRSRMGVAPGQYLLRLRLEKAERLMTVYHEPPATAAASVGYGDICQFSGSSSGFTAWRPGNTASVTGLTRPWRGGAKCGILPVTGTERRTR